MMKIIENYSLKSLNTFGVDVKTRYIAEIFSDNDLFKLLEDKEFESVRKFILGGGSNILFTKDFEGLVIKNSIPGINIIDEDDESIIIETGAGVNWDDFVSYCVEKKWCGVENLSLIPGTVGAAPIQNIGAYGQELKNVLYNLEGIFIETGEKKIFNNYECKFSYRESIFKNEFKNKFVITRIVFKLSKKPEVNISYPLVREELNNRKISDPKIRDLRKIVVDIRNSKLPDPKIIGNAGSFFKNPVVRNDKFKMLKEKYPDLNSYPVDDDHVKLSAAALIEKCGWKGKRIGNCGSYEKQPLVIVNYGEATAGEILELANNIRSSVEENFEVTLQQEVNLV
ncbi:UDP-N-acetylmuramate dehydrogenase [bacterium BMS3Abin03]|nr:UDP-N-acetylmuramate dehydrogenase [bacterium BMS3Abin03]MCG6960831.1 UDP-N-acetylmuramate dehydrogenase [bacterium BMS3Abin03]